MGFSQEALAHEAGLDRTYISMLERGIRNPTLEVMRLLADALEVKLVELIEIEFPKGKILKTHKDSQISTNILPTLYGTSVSCGRPLAVDDNVSKEISIEKLLIKNPEITFFVKASGDSMWPTICDGDLLVIEKTQKPKQGDIVLVRLDGDYSVKRLHKSGKNTELLADNSLYHPVILNNFNEIVMCGVVRSVIKLKI